MEKMQVVEVGGIRVLTTKQIAEAYGTEVGTVQHNFRRNKEKYTAGKHYIKVEGKELRDLKERMQFTHIHDELKSRGQSVRSLKEEEREYEFQTLFKQAKSVYLWTEKGALLHAKSLNTEKAWEVYDYLVDFYFRVKEEPRQQAHEKEKKGTEVVDVPENAKIQNMIRKLREDMICMNILLDECDKYVSMEEYAERRKAAGNIAGVIMMDMSNLSGIRPNMVRKPGI